MKLETSLPSLRFPKFAGDAGWKTKKLGDFCKIRTGKLDANAASLEGEYRFYTCAKSFLMIDNYVFDTEALLISGNGAGVGYVHYYHGKFNAYQRTYVLDGFKEAINFVQFQLETKLRKRIQLESKAGNIPYIVMDTLAGMRLSLPTLPEQRKIADFLTAVDGRIGQLIQKKALLEDYKKGVMQQLFAQALRFKDDKGKDFPEWEEKTLGAIASFSKGSGISKAEVHEDGVTPCIRYGELYTHYSELIGEVKSRTNVEPKYLVLSQRNDVIIPASGETHIDIATASCVMEAGIALGGDLNIIRAKTNGVFLAYYLNNAMKHAIAGMAQGSSVIHLYPAQLKLLRLSVPSLPEQTKIADFLTALDRKIESVSQQITHTQTFKRGLLQQMFV